jgi:hypothetical protein
MIGALDMTEPQGPFERSMGLSEFLSSLRGVGTALRAPGRAGFARTTGDVLQSDRYARPSRKSTLILSPAHTFGGQDAKRIYRGDKGRRCTC